jgi:acetyl coenzyme A synthetase (ADP forming)-like protein
MPSIPGPDLGWANVDVVLADGGVAHLRPIRPDDSERLVDFHRSLSPETRYMRFFSLHPELTSAEVERFTQVDYDQRLAFVLELRGDLIAVGRYDAVDDGRSAEVAFVVGDPHQGRGIGSILLEYLAIAARRRSIHHFFADTLASNQRMLRVFRDAGYTLTTRFEDGVIRVEIPLVQTPALVEAIERREHQAESASIARLLRPRTVAVIGVSRQPGSIGHELFLNILRNGFEGPVYPVNPSASSVASVRAWPTINDVPDEIDLAVVVVPAAAAVDVVEQCARKGVQNLLIVTGGFAEIGAGGAGNEARLLHVAREAGMRIVGPNCIGVVNTSPAVRLDATFAATVPTPGRVGFLSQSGALGIEVLSAAAEVGIGVSTFVSVGNKADVSGNDLLQYWEDDDATAVLLLYLESFGNPRKFSRLARRVSRRKPIIAVKSGRSEAGQRAASSHTAAMASSDRAVDAVFRHTGVVRVRSVRELLDVAQLLESQPLPGGRRLAVLGNSGGPGILAADTSASVGLELPTLPDEARHALEAVVPPNSAVANPIDMTAAAGPAHFRAALDVLLREDTVDAVVVIFTPTVVAGSAEIGAAIVEACRGAQKPVVVNFLATPVRPPTLSDGDVRVPWYRTIEDAIGAIAAALRYSEWLARPVGEFPSFGPDPRSAVRTLTAGIVAAHPTGRWLVSDEVEQVLSAYGIPSIRSADAFSAAEAAAIAEQFGRPVALKATGPTILHKTEVGGVALDLPTGAAVFDAYERMSSALGDAMTGALVQLMAPSGVETIVGVSQDPAFGPIVMFGLGGVTAELLDDVAFRLAPLSDRDAEELIGEPRSAALLFGYRGAAPSDVAALSDLLLRIGRMAEEQPELVEVDLNPVLVSVDGVTVLDARMRVAPASELIDARRLR